VEYVLQTNSLVEMHTWLSAVQQSMSAETVSTETAESQPIETLVVLFLVLFLNIVFVMCQTGPIHLHRVINRNVKFQIYIYCSVVSSRLR